MLFDVDTVWSACTVRRHLKMVQHWRSTCARRGTSDCMEAILTTNGFTLPAIWCVSRSVHYSRLIYTLNAHLLLLLSWQTDVLHCLEFASMTSTRTGTGKQRHLPTVTVMTMMMMMMMTLQRLIHVWRTSLKRKFFCQAVVMHVWSSYVVC